MRHHAKRNTLHPCDTFIWINLNYEFLNRPNLNDFKNTFAIMISYEAVFWWQRYEMFYTDKEFDNDWILNSYLHKNTIAEINDYLYFTGPPDFGPATVIDDLLGKK